LFKSDITNRERHNEVVRDSHLPNQTELPLVSVCIPAFNSEATLGETLEAVLEQEYPHLDIVVSDNQSTDGTKAIVQRYAERGVRYCWHSEGRPEWAMTLPSYVGVYTNWDFVLSQGRGEYLCLFHSDDLYEPSIVRQQVDVMQAHPNVGAVFTRMRMIGEDSRPIRLGISIMPDEILGRTSLDFPTLLNGVLAHSNFLPTPSVMLRRSVIEKMGGFDERRFLTSADLEMWLRIAHRGYEIAIIDQPLLKYRISKRQGGGQYHNLRTSLWDFFRVLDHYLNQSGVREMVLPQPLALYELQRANDQVLCAINSLVLGQVEGAQRYLHLALNWNHLVTACRYRRSPARLVGGLGLQLSIRLGFGKNTAILFHRFREQTQERHQHLIPS
jgi:glycosyltransferase involved in cell wall biosynthesis